MTLAFEWYEEYRDNVFHGDSFGRRHYQMLEYFDEVMEDDDNPRYNVACLQKARRLSVTLGEDLFTLWCDAWLGRELHTLGETKKTREVLSDAVLRARKPIYANTPQRLMVHVHLAMSLAFTDPISYEKEVRKLCQFVLKESGDCEEHRTQALSILCALSIEKHDRKGADAAIAKLQQHVAVDIESGQLWSVNYFQAKLAMRDQDWNAALKQADEGMLDPDLTNEPKKSFYLIRACALASLGDKKSARALYRRGNALRCDIPDADDYTFCTMYWLIMGEPQAAINIRLGEQEVIKAKGRYWTQYRSALHLVQIYESLENTREANRWRRTSQKFLAKFRNPQAVAGLRLIKEYP